MATGCVSLPPAEKTFHVVSKYVDRPLKVDAQMSDPAWGDAVEYALLEADKLEQLPPVIADAIRRTKHGTDVRAKVLHDKDHLYIGFRIENDDIWAGRRQDQEHLYRHGDCMEVFLKPLHSNSYLELYANASGNKTTFYFRSRSFSYGRFHEDQSLLPGLLQVYSHVDGTLNNSEDRDRGWTTVMVINRDELAKQLGVPLDQEHPWTILLAGYAYSSRKIYSSNFTYPKLPQANFHYHEYYAKLILDQ